MRNTKTSGEIPTFGEFISLFPLKSSRIAFELLFLSSNTVNSFDEYYSLKNNLIDFKLISESKLISKTSNCNYPIERSVKKVFFNNQKLKVEQGVFMPRPETESVVKIACDWIKKLKIENFAYLDLCTGSGNIALSIVESFKDKLKICAVVDFSFSACNNALNNIATKNYIGKIKVYLSNWTQFIKEKGRWEVITINPPYVSEEEFKQMSKDQYSKYDPKWALQAGNNGWTHYSEIIQFALKNPFWKLIVLEASEFHEKLWEENITNIKEFQIYKYRDYLNKFRAVVLVKN